MVQCLNWVFLSLPVANSLSCCNRCANRGSLFFCGRFGVVVSWSRWWSCGWSWACPKFLLGFKILRWSVDALQGFSSVRCLEWDVLLAVGESEGLGLILIGWVLLCFSTGFLRRDSYVPSRQWVLNSSSVVVELRPWYSRIRRSKFVRMWSGLRRFNAGKSSAGWCLSA